MAIVEDRSEVSSDNLPKPIVDVLERAIRRRRNIILLRGVLAIAAVALGVLLGLMAIDIGVTIVSSTVRWLLSAAALLIVVGAAMVFLVYPLSRRMSLIRMAQLVDAHHPEFEERVSSTVELLSARHGQYGEASPMLLEALTQQAVLQVRAVEPKREFNLKSIYPFLGAAAGAALIWAFVWTFWPTQTKHLLTRIINPYTSTGNLGAADLSVDPGNRTVAIGDPLRIEATLRRGGAQQATLLRQDGTAEEVSMEMVRLTDQAADSSKFALTIPSVTEPLTYRVLIAGALSQNYKVQVTPRPAVSQYNIQYEYPAYTGRSNRTVNKSEGKIVAPVGSRITLTALCNKPLSEANLLMGTKKTPAKEIAAEGEESKITWQFFLEPSHAGKWSLSLKDKFDIQTTTEEHLVQVVPDMPPVVAIVDPKEPELRLRPDDRLPIDYRVREDYGLSSVSFLVRTGSGAEISVKTSHPKQSTIEEQTWVGRAVLDLRTLPSVPRMEVLLDVKDSLPEALGGPQRALSRPIVIVFDANAQSYSAQSAEKSIRKLQTLLTEALNFLKGAKGQIASVRPNLDKQPLRLTPEGARAVENSHNQTGQAETLLWKVYEGGEDPELAEHATQAAQIADQHVSPARQALELIPLAHVKQEQVDQAKVAEEKIDAAIAAIETIIKKLAAEQERLAKARELASELGSVADDQARLRQATENAKDAKPNSAEEIADRIRDAQWQIAHEATQLARKIDQSGFNASVEHREAADLARQTANRLIDKKFNEAMPLGKQAADKFDKAKDKLAAAPPPASPQNPLDPPFAEAAKQLAERQKRVNEQLEALKEGDLAKALQSLQKDVAERAKQLAEKSEKLDKPKDPGDPAGSPQKGNPQASKDVKMPHKDTIGQAVEKAEMAAADLGHIDNIPKISPPKFVEGPQSPSDSPGGNPDGGQGTQGGGSNTGAGSSKAPSPSNNNINNTIAKGKNLGKATLTAEALLNQKPGANKGPSGGSGTELQKDAEELLRKGLAQILADNNPEAKGFGGFGGGAPDKEVPETAPKEFSAEAGEEQPDGQSPSEGEGPQGKSGEPGAKKAGKGGKLKKGQARVASRLAELGISGNDWLKLPSDLRAEMLQSNDDRAPREYRELVRRYFQTMARRSGESK
ncbi:MAG: hypothetical protein K8T91_07365 [Planctomycetes bacterium]|nr:hypothetical protein [Planctomycetota bacterium]